MSPLLEKAMWKIRPKVKKELFENVQFRSRSEAPKKDIHQKHPKQALEDELYYFEDEDGVDGREKT